MTPTFTVLIGSAGRPSLKHTLESIKRQGLIEGDEVFVSFDSYEKDINWLMSRANNDVRPFGLNFIPIDYDAGYHFYGVEQINHVFKRGYNLSGTHILTLGDDDVLVDGAYRKLRQAVAAYPDQVVLFKFVAPWREILWERPVMTRSRISGCCIAAPKQFVGLMDTKTQNPDGTEYKEHDFDWMQDIIKKSGKEPYWLDEVLVIARPEENGQDVKHRGVSRCWNCSTWRWLEDVSVTDIYCPKCNVVLQPAEVLGVA